MVIFLEKRAHLGPFFVTLWIVIIGLLLFTGPVHGQRVVGYYPQWIQDTFSANQIDHSVITHVIHAFAWPDDQGNISTYSNMLDTDINASVHSEGASILLAFGGWGNCDGFPGMVSSATSRENFIDGLIEIIEEYDYDGIDLDWEFPSTTSETNNLTLLVQEIRSAFNDLNPDLMITMAVGTSNWSGQHFDYESLVDYIDWFSMMGYDFHGNWTSHAGHNAPLYASPPGDPEGSVHTGMNYLLNTRDIPPEKLNLGVPFYGKRFNASVINGGFSGDVLDLRYTQIVDLINAGLEYHWDDDAYCPYLQNGSHTQLVTFDDPVSIQEKSEYAIQRGLGGMMIWALGYDLYGDSQELVESIGQHFLYTRPSKGSFTPDVMTISDGYPNPFNNRISISVHNPKGDQLAAYIYSISGQLISSVSSGYFRKGHNTYWWNGKNDLGNDVGSGIYIFSVSSEKDLKTKKMVLLK